MFPRNVVQLSPGRIILSALLAAIALGTFLLSLPISRTMPISFIDLLFTATSITCVTGLLTVPLTHFTPFGQTIILILMQIGGLGLITLTIFIMSLFVEFGLGTQILAGKLLELESWKNIKNLIIFIVTLTLIIELLGALCIFFIIKTPEMSLIKGIFLSLFHAVSSFCDAGFSLFPQGMISYKFSYGMLLITSALMVSGGLGFITWHEIIQKITAWRTCKRSHFSLHSKIVISMTILLIGSSTLLYWLLERNNTLANLPPSLTIINALFNAISSRSSGFSSIDTLELNLATFLLIMVVSFIGSSPGSTGSGIKTTTAAIFLAVVATVINDKTTVQIKGRRIAKDQVLKALAIVALSASWIIISTFCLLITERGWDFLDILFECVAAFATLGLSTGITPYLSATGKCFIMTSMIIGRIGSLTVVLALKKRTEQAEFAYPEERVLLS